MKLNKEIKDRIDNYFESISAEELYELSIKKYRFPNIEYELDNLDFDSVIKSIYSSDLSCMTYKKETSEFCDISLAA